MRRGLLVSIFLCTAASAIEIRLLPVAATGTAVMNTSNPLDAEITIDPGATVRIDAQVDNWGAGSEQLRAVQVECMLSSLTSGTAGSLAVDRLDDNPANGACDFSAAMCPVCGPPNDFDGLFVDSCRKRCNNAAGSPCNGGNPVTCPGEGGILACILGYPDFFGQMPPLSGFGSGADNVSQLALLWTGTNAVGAVYDGNPHYVASLVLAASANARGTFTLTQWPSPCVGCNVNGSLVRNQSSSNFVQPTLLGQVRIHIRPSSCCAGGTCQEGLTSAECDALAGTFRPGVACPSSGGPPCPCQSNAECVSQEFACQSGECAPEVPEADPQGCVYFNDHANCDDGVACTVNECVGEAGDADGCLFTPDDGACDDSIGCTEDACDPFAGCIQTPQDTLCDDDDDCTIDVCDPDNKVGPDGCLHSALPPDVICEIDDDCTALGTPAATCGPKGTCVCLQEVLPSLCLVPVYGDENTCVDGDETLTVEVQMSGPITQGICAAQLSLAYDTTSLGFLAMQPGGSAPFLFEVFEFVNESSGTIDYAVSPPVAEPCVPTFGPATVARITFRALGSTCVGSSVCFRDASPLTRLVPESGGTVYPLGQNQSSGALCTKIDGIDCLALPCCTGPIESDAQPPAFECPFSGLSSVFHTGSDCGVTRRNLIWDPIVATDNCDSPPPPVLCTALYHPFCVGPADCGGGACGPDGTCVAGVPRDDLAATGGDFPPGATRITCSASDECGNSQACNFEIRNSGMNTICVNVELSPSMVNQAVRRGIEFRASDCGVSPVQHASCVDVAFGPPNNVPGHGSTCFQLPPGNWACLEAGDPAHSLLSTCSLVCVADFDIQDPNTGEPVNLGDAFAASIKGNPEIDDTCHWLVQGNLNGDEVIDILDFALFVDDQGCSTIDTDCDDIPETRPGCANDDEAGIPGASHADFNGNGLVNVFDFSFLVVNFFQNDTPGCDVLCDELGGVETAGAKSGRDSVSVVELQRMGLGRLAATADLSGDGVVDVTDIAFYLNSDAASGEE